MTDPMPVFTIKAKDRLAMIAITAYREACEAAGLRDQAREVEKARSEFFYWRLRNADVVKMPDHKHQPVRQAEPAPQFPAPGEVMACWHAVQVVWMPGAGWVHPYSRTMCEDPCPVSTVPREDHPSA